MQTAQQHIKNASTYLQQIPVTSSIKSLFPETTEIYNQIGPLRLFKDVYTQLQFYLEDMLSNHHIMLYEITDSLSTQINSNSLKETSLIHSQSSSNEDDDLYAELQLTEMSDNDPAPPND